MSPSTVLSPRATRRVVTRPYWSSSVRAEAAARTDRGQAGPVTGSPGQQTVVLGAHQLVRGVDVPEADEVPELVHHDRDDVLTPARRLEDPACGRGVESHRAADVVAQRAPPVGAPDAAADAGYPALQLRGLLRGLPRDQGRRDLAGRQTTEVTGPGRRPEVAVADDAEPETGRVGDLRHGLGDDALGPGRGLVGV